MESTLNNPNHMGEWLAAYAGIRRDCYAMLASLLGQAPSERTLGILQNLQWDEAIPGKMDQALSRLRRAACRLVPARIETEFNRLFVGMGCGEMVPYASWYQERMIQSSPLARLRADLMHLGFVRKPDSCESEDHAGALCEVMGLICRETNGIPHAAQAEFFERHVASWMGRFFRELQEAKNAEFYRAVASFGVCFLEAESEYLNVDVNSEISNPKGGLHNEKRNHRQPAHLH